MCGIAGIAGPLQDDASSVVATMTQVLQHRGPDDAGQWSGASAALGHRRLSIIDLSERGRQPMGDAELKLVYNGEIYNFETLRSELERAGYAFASRTDSEVLLHGYRAWGLTGLLERIQGMFAFALWDALAGKLHLARDRLGIKPLFYRLDGGALHFASEVKALLAALPATVEESSLLWSLQHIAVPAPHTMYSAVRQLEPATWLTFDAATGRCEQQTYWRWRPEAQIADAKDAVKLVWDAICRSVSGHLVADVPVGVLLSGGLDSSLVAAACAEAGARPTCLTIAMPDADHDESPYAAALCRRYGFEHWVESIPPDAAQQFDAQLGDVFDEPFASSAALSALQVSKLAAQRFGVMLSGEGGDEIFGGYRWYRQWLDWYGERGEPAPLWHRPRQALRAALGKRHAPADPMAGYAQLMGAFSMKQLRRLFVPAMLERHPRAADAAAFYRQIDQPGLRGFNRVQALDLAHFLPAVCLTKMDRASMAFGLEVRVPMLDRALVELAGRIDPWTRNPHLALKGLLKRIARDRLPAELLAKKKQGFSTPVDRWFTQQWIVSEIERDQSSSNWWRGIFASNVVAGVRRLRGRKLWRFWHVWRWAKRSLMDER